MITAKMEKQREPLSGRKDFWKDFLTMADYFNHAIAPVQKHFDLKSSDLFYSLGLNLGQKVAEKYESASLKEMVLDLSRLWEELGIGNLIIAHEDPLELVVSNCTICGQLAGSGEMYDCAFHEGFFKGALEKKSQGDVKLSQVTNFEGVAGTWCRRYLTDLNLSS
jgi:predicted hydrocarbon binding protein